MARRSSEREAAACPSTWLWLLAGILIGIFLSFLMYLRAWVPQIPEPPATPPQALVPPVAPTPVAAAPTPPVASEPPANAPAARFEFYDMLPKSEVNPPNRPPAEVEIAQAEAAAQSLNPPPALPGVPMRPEDFPVAGAPNRPMPALNPPAGSYLVQAASFREPSAAAELLQRLAAQGLTGDVQTAVVNGVNWYRVRVGPYQTPAQASQTQSLLQQQHMNAIVLPIR